MTEYALCYYDEETGEWAAMDTRMVESRKAALATLPEVIRMQQRIAAQVLRIEGLCGLINEALNASDPKHDFGLDLYVRMAEATLPVAPSPEDK